MKKIKYIIVFLIILLLTVVIILFTIQNFGNNQKNAIDNVSEEENIEFQTISNYDMFYTIKSILNSYVEYIKETNCDTYIDTVKAGISLEEAKQQSQKQGLEAIKNILDEQYKNNMEITDDIIIEKQKNYAKNSNLQETEIYDLNIENIQWCNLENNINLFLITSKLNNKDFNILLKLDIINNTFSIYLSDFIEKYSENDYYRNINISSISLNDYNKYKNVKATDEYIIKEYFSEYRMKMIENQKEAYNMLNTDYMKKKFGNYDNFIQYVNKNEMNIKLASIQEYQVNTINGKKEYICYDQYGKYYIFTEQDIINYNVILDTYTIDLPDFLNKYNNSNDATKAGLDLQKIIDALNDEDFKYVYNKLDETFKENNFPTVKDIEQYIKNNITINSNVVISNYQNSNDLHMFDVTFSYDEVNTITKTFIIKLLDGTDFVMSFNV